MSVLRDAVKLLGVLAVMASGVAQATDAKVAGTFKGNGVPAKVAFITVRNREPFADKESLQLVITEKDHTKDKRPDFNASFGRFGSALIISFHKDDGSVFGCEVAHAAHTKGTFSSVGSLKIEDFKIADGQVQGRLKTDGEKEFFKQTWEVDLTFSAPVPPSDPNVAKPKPPSTEPSVTRPTPDKPATELAKSTKPASPAITLKQLPLPTDATDVVYKEAVGMVNCKSPTDVKTVAAVLQKKLAEQGWAKQGADLVTPKSVILSRKQGGATVTVMVKPADTGSQIQIMTTGLGHTVSE